MNGFLALINHEAYACFLFFAFSRPRTNGLLCGAALLGVLGWCSSLSSPFSFLPCVLRYLSMSGIWIWGMISGSNWGPWFLAGDFAGTKEAQKKTYILHTILHELRSAWEWGVC